MNELDLTDAQVALIAPRMKAGVALLGRITRKPFNGENPVESGALVIEFGAVPEASLPALREAIRKANQPSTAGKKPRRKRTSQPQPQP